jgi:DNA sulfur modification protein DndB
MGGREGIQKKLRIKKAKTESMAFEDQVWVTFASLGFDYMNLDQTLKIPYDDKTGSEKQIDVLAADEEVILIIECKATQDGKPRHGKFKDTIEAIEGRKEGILKSLKKFFPDKKHKVRFILATNNYIISKNDTERMETFGILHFDEETIRYYQELVSHLGSAARYQLLGALFEGHDIPELKNKIPAIQGKMGGHTYYSFSIEPEKLLKIGYVLHRNKANKRFMPTYQRLIKKSRLKSINEFLNDDGFFPNSIIISINSLNQRNLRFDKASGDYDESVSKIGTLYLPKKYRSAFIIDGQHRLYGYANSEYRETNSIPVVAFLGLDRSEQVKLFMQINENQKQIPKNLRNTLNADILWDSKIKSDQALALKLQLAQDLGEEKISPLYERIQVGENPKTKFRCLTIDTIKIGLDRGSLLSSYTGNKLTRDGLMDMGNIDETFDRVFNFLTLNFNYVRKGASDQWETGEETPDGFLTINAGIESLIRLFSDILNHLAKDEVINPKLDKVNNISAEMQYYLDPLIEHFDGLGFAERILFRKSHGTAGRTKYWRTLQKIINEARPEFCPVGLDTYWKDEDKRYNEESFKIIRDLETHFKSLFREILEEKHGSSWFKSGTPKSVWDDATKLASDKNYEVEDVLDEVQPWDCLNIISYKKIAIYGRNWTESFEHLLTKPDEDKISGGKEAKTKWMVQLNRIRNENFHSYSVKEEEYNFLLELQDWLTPN